MGASMKRLVLLVDLHIKAGMMPAFLDIARQDAHGSVTDEPGCRRFDILHDADDPQRVRFYEVYDDETALAAHRDTPHFKAYAAASPPFIESRNVTRLSVEERGK